jgi:hypothetical protein
MIKQKHNIDGLRIRCGKKYGQLVGGCCSECGVRLIIKIKEVKEDGRHNQRTIGETDNSPG